MEVEKRYPAPLTKADVREIIKEALEEFPNVGAEVHLEHHDWVKAQIKRDQAKTELYRKAAAALVQWSVLGVLGFIATWVSTHIILKH